MWRTAESPRITVADFFEAGREMLQLDWEANAESAVGREITEVALNRPGLALAGFLRYFAHRRIQVLGLAEMTYLGSLPAAERIDRLRALGACAGLRDVARPPPAGLRPPGRGGIARSGDADASGDRATS